MKKIIKIFSICTLSILLLVTAIACNPFGINSPTQGDLPSSEVQAQSVKFNGQESNQGTALTLVQAIKKVERSVAAVEMQENGTAVSRGSAVIVSVDSGKDSDDQDVYYVLTCHHVISATGDIVLYVPDDNARNYGDNGYDSSYAFKGKIGNAIYNSYPLTLVGGDKESDVAVLRLDVGGLKNKNGDPVSIETAQVAVDANYSISKGESVFAIGNPSGKLPGTVTSGTISYLEREIYLNEVGYLTCLQLDTDIYHGSSGGGLFNMYGELIGITNAGSDDYSGINYAIPYKQNSEDDRGFVNIATQLIGTATATNYGYISGRWNIGLVVNTTGTEGIEIISIDRASNAEGKLLAGDIVKQVSFTVNGNTTVKDINNITDFSSVVNLMKRYLKFGDSFKIKVNRPKSFLSGYDSITQTIEIKSQFIFCNTYA